MSDRPENTRRNFLKASSVAASSLVMLAAPARMASGQAPAKSSKNSLRIFSNGQDLGDLILSLSPYTFQKVGNNDLYEIKGDAIEFQESPGNWTFKGAPHNIARSVRIPYTFYWLNKATNSTIEVRDYFLVGFEGGGSY